MQKIPARQDHKVTQGRFQQVVESAPNAMVMVDENGKIQLVNKATVELFGYSREELLSMKVETLIPGRFQGKHSEYRKGFHDDPKVRAMGAGRDLYGLRKDGSEVSIEIGLNPIDMEEGNFVLASIVDITGRKKVEQERADLLRSLEQRVQERTKELTAQRESAFNIVQDINEARKKAEEAEKEVVKTSRDLEGQKKALDQFAIVAETDAKGKITYVNDQFCKTSKYSREELIGKDHRNVANSGYHSKEFWHNFWTTIQAGKIFRGDVRNKAKDGTIYWEDTTIVPFLGKDGKPAKYLAIRANITDRKLAENELREKTEELQRVNQELKQSDQVKDEFISNVSHELRTPLTIVRESISQIVDGLFGEVNEKQNNYLNKCLKNLDRLGKIINNLLDISTIEKGKLKLYKESVNIVGLVKEVIANFTLQVEKKGLEIRAVVPTGRVDAFVDKEKLVQVLTNLVGNACKFTEKGHIEVSVSQNDTNIECRVKDTGAGIAPQDLPRLFSKFEQIGRQSGSGAKGTGLGLSIAKAIIELHDGQITMESEPGRGTQFIITLPKLDISRESVRNLMDRLRENTQKYDHCSVLVFSIKDFNAKFDESLDALEELIKKQLYRQSDQTVKDQGSVYVILADTKKEDAMNVVHRIREAIDQKDGKGPLKGLKGLAFNMVNLPEDGSAPEELMSKLKMNKEDA